MTSKPDSVYFAERLAAELKALETVTNDAARRAHQALADHYAQLLAAHESAGENSRAAPQATAE